MARPLSQLTPLTLELGGRAPVSSPPTAPLALAVRADDLRQEPQRRPDLRGPRLRAAAEGAGAELFGRVVDGFAGGFDGVAEFAEFRLDAGQDVSNPRTSASRWPGCENPSAGC